MFAVVCLVLLAGFPVAFSLAGTAIIFAGIGALCVGLKGNFLDYSVLSQILPATDAIMARSHAMLGVEIGVAFTVMCSMFAIYVSLASDGHYEKGL